MTTRVFVLSFLLAAAAAVLAASSPALPGASKTIDRTFSCAVGVKGGIRSLDVDARTGYRNGDRFEWLAQVGLSTWKLGEKLPLSLAGVTAGWPPPSPELRGGLGFDTKLCTVQRTRIPLTRRGLVGGPASAWGDTYRCFTPARVLVRIRANLREPASLEQKRAYLGAVTRVLRGQVAVATPAGKPVVYGEVLESGQARLFTARSCQ